MKQGLVGRVSTVVLAGVVMQSVAMAAPKKSAPKPGAKAAGKASPAQIAAGKKVLQSSGCTGCHKMEGKGGTSGPDLSHEGQSHDATWIAQKLKAPKSTNKASIMPPFSGSPNDLASLAAYLASLK